MDKYNYKDINKERKSGIIMHISSLWSEYGIGNLGEEAYKFADFLKEAGQCYWQILPIGPTGYGDSPYQSFSSFAGNPYFIDFKILAKEGYLKEEDFKNLEMDDEKFVDEVEKRVNLEMREEEKRQNYISKNGFYTKSPFARFAVLIAGVVMNFLSAFIVLFFVVAAMTEIAHDIGFLLQLKITWKLFLQIFYETLNGVKLLFTGHVAPKEITGPVGLPKVVGHIYKSEGISVMKNIFALLSVNIGIMNLLPIPALDGGRILFVIPEFFGIKVHPENALVLTNISAKNYDELAKARKMIQDRVFEKFGLKIEQEPLEI